MREQEDIQVAGEDREKEKERKVFKEKNTNE